MGALLTDRHLDLLKVILDQTMKMTDAETSCQRREENKKTTTINFRCDGGAALPGLPMTAKMSVLVKCL